MDFGFEWITHYGYVAIFVLLMLGIVGLPVPDEALLTFVGYLSFKGDLHLVPSLVTAFLGTACGITMSYALGRMFGLPIVTRLGVMFHASQKRITEVQTWVCRWGPYALPLAYFLPGIRHMAALMLGASQLLVRRFAAFAYAGALLWTATFIGIGYGFGAEWSRSSPAVHRSIVITALTIALTVAVILSVAWRRGRRQN